MKKFLTATLLAIILTMSLIGVPAVMAETKTYYYIKENTQLIIDEESALSGSINIPKTWYVLATSTPDSVEGDVTYKFVKYNGILGKVDATKLSVKTTAKPSANFFTAPIKNIQTTSGFGLSVYTASSGDGASLVTIPINSEVTYLADTNSKTYCISYQANNATSFGFIRKTEIKDLQEIIPTVNTDSLDPDNAEAGSGDDLKPPATDNGKQPPTNNLLRILLIVAICVLAVFVVFLIFKPSKKSKGHDDFYEDYNNHS